MRKRSWNFNSLGPSCNSTVSTAAAAAISTKLRSTETLATHGVFFLPAGAEAGLLGLLGDADTGRDGGGEGETLP